jgi:hypothetical protein
MGFADSLARGGWYENDVSHAEKPEGDDPQGSAVADSARWPAYAPAL